MSMTRTITIAFFINISTRFKSRARDILKGFYSLVISHSLQDDYKTKWKREIASNT